MRPSIEFFVPGEPKGQPRPRAFARKFGNKWQARVYDAKTAEGWKGQIAISWKQRMPDAFEPFVGPVALSIIFQLPRPQYHYGKRGLKEDAPKYCMKKPDADNFAKAVMDAMTQLGVFVDDSQVCDLRAVKKFVRDGEIAGAHISVKELDPTTL